MVSYHLMAVKELVLPGKGSGQEPIMNNKRGGTKKPLTFNIVHISR